MSWYIYIVQCSDLTLYTGITKDLQRRINEHNHDDQLSAKYTRYRRPVTLLYQEKADNQSQAVKREIAIKKLTRDQKLNLINSKQNEIKYEIVRNEMKSEPLT